VDCICWRKVKHMEDRGSYVNVRFIICIHHHIVYRIMLNYLLLNPLLIFGLPIYLYDVKVDFALTLCYSQLLRYPSILIINICRI
jgi:hypothetical protein